MSVLNIQISIILGLKNRRNREQHTGYFIYSSRTWQQLLNSVAFTFRYCIYLPSTAIC